MKDKTDKQDRKATTDNALLNKALDIIELVQHKSAVSRLRARDIIALTQYPQSTVYRILQTLIARDYLRLDDRDHAYELGAKFSQQIKHQVLYTAINAAAHPHMTKLSAISGETVTLGVLEQSWVRILSRIDANAGDEGKLVEIGPTRPLYCTGLGKALLSWLPLDSQTELISNISFERITSRTIITPEDLKSDIAAAKANGFATDKNEIIAEVSCVAVPILSEEAYPVAALSISAPTSRMPDERIRSLAEVLSVAATSIQNQIKIFAQV